MRPERAVFIKPTVVGAHSLGLAIHSRLPEQLQSRRPRHAKRLRRRTAADLLPCVSAAPFLRAGTPTSTNTTATAAQADGPRHIQVCALPCRPDVRKRPLCRSRDGKIT